MVRSPSVVTVANEQVPIVTVCQMLGVDLPDDVGSGRSRKVSCPFGEMYHSDGGIAATMRVYPDSNSAYCFSCSTYYTPVSLAARAMGCPVSVAASRLLDRIGYRPPDGSAAWQRVQRFEPEPDKALLADALKTFCRRIDAHWSSRQFDPAVASVLTRCLGLLDLVKSADEVHVWLEGCKEAMRRALYVEELSPSQKYELLWGAMNNERRR